MLESFPECFLGASRRVADAPDCVPSTTPHCPSHLPAICRLYILQNVYTGIMCYPSHIQQLRSYTLHSMVCNVRSTHLCFTAMQIYALWHHAMVSTMPCHTTATHARQLYADKYCCSALLFQQQWLVCRWAEVERAHPTWEPKASLLKPMQP